MQYRNLGRAGVKVSPLCLGTAQFGGRVEADTTTTLVHAALDAGINVIDTANIYTCGRSEELVGRAIRGRRHRVVLASKVYNRMGDGPNDHGSSRYHIMAQVEASLRRLQTDHIDLYQLHRPDPTTPIGETLRALDDLQRQGKIVYFGTSVFPAWQLCEAQWTSDRLGLAPIVSEQPRYSLLYRGVEAEVLPFCREYGIAILPFSPLHRGWLTGKYRRGQPAPAGSRFASSGTDLHDPEHEAKFDALEALQKIAQAKNVTLSQLALAWLLAQPEVTAPILGARTLDQLHDNLGALDVTITSEDRETIDAIVPPTVNMA
ncbi:MAG: aldo/keto reductase [Dehalococcoidia bacterium]|nr:aldo/keto reductase [Dehalococcoidia bacterium]